MPLEHEWDNCYDIGRWAVAQVTRWLQQQDGTAKVTDVQDDEEYRQIDVDLIWWTRSRKGSKGSEQKVEVKGDRNHRTGNFFFETVSNTLKGTRGWVLYTEANQVFYCFVRVGDLYILPWKATHEWFIANRNRFDEREVKTADRRGKTRGSLVPIKTVLDEVPGVRHGRVEQPAGAFRLQDGDQVLVTCPECFLTATILYSTSPSADDAYVDCLWCNYRDDAYSAARHFISQTIGRRDPKDAIGEEPYRCPECEFDTMVEDDDEFICYTCGIVSGGLLSSCSECGQPMYDDFQEGDPEQGIPDAPGLGICSYCIERKLSS